MLHPVQWSAMYHIASSIVHSSFIFQASSIVHSNFIFQYTTLCRFSRRRVGLHRVTMEHLCHRSVALWQSHHCLGARVRSLKAATLNSRRETNRLFTLLADGRPSISATSGGVKIHDIHYTHDADLKRLLSRLMWQRQVSMLIFALCLGRAVALSERPVQMQTEASHAALA